MQKVKLALQPRMKNPWFWIGIGSVIIAASGVDPETLTSWPTVLEALKGIAVNPISFVTVITAILAVFVNPTTKGLSD